MKSLFAIQDAGNITIIEKVSKKPFIHINYANTFGLNVNSNQTYARGKGVNRIAFSQITDGTNTISCEMASMKWFSLLTNADIKTDSATVLKREVFTVGSGSPEFTLAGTPTMVLGVSTLTQDENTDIDTFDIIKTGTVATGQALVDGTSVELFASDVSQGDKVGIIYLVSKNTGVTRFRMSAKPKSKYYEIYADVSVKFEDGSEDFVQVHVYKAKVQETLALTFDASNPSTFDMTFDMLPDPTYLDDNKQPCMFEWVEITE